MVEHIKQFDEKVFTYELAGRPLVVKTGKIAGLANGAALIQYGETTVLATATASAAPREGIDFLPLSVDYDEKMYAVGKIPGGFLKREGKPSEKAVLAGRVIDRPVRPLFPKDLRNDISLLLTTERLSPMLWCVAGMRWLPIPLTILSSVTDKTAVLLFTEIIGGLISAISLLLFLILLHSHAYTHEHEEYV